MDMCTKHGYPASKCLSQEAVLPSMCYEAMKDAYLKGVLPGFLSLVMSSYLRPFFATKSANLSATSLTFSSIAAEQTEDFHEYKQQQAASK
jgi:hypothetical protein